MSKTILVTGSTDGIGRQTALELLRLGHRVIVHGRSPAKTAWSLGNAFAQHPFDGYPYVFFNLLLGLMVALQGPLIMMSQNRQSQQDRAQAASDFKVNLKNEMGIERLLVEVSTLRRELNQRLARVERDGGSGRSEPELPKVRQ